MRSAFRSLAVGCTVLLGLMGAGCDSPSQPTTNPASQPIVVEYFTGTLQPSGDAFYSFSMSVGGDVALTLLSMTGPSVPGDAIFPIGIGLPVGTGCTASVDAATAPGASPQFTTSRTAGVYCVRVADNARLGAPATFSLSIRHPR